MDVNFSHIQELVDRPGESLSVEVKRWLDPDQPDGIAKIVKAAIALRNHGGGYLVIGFDNESFAADTNNIPSNVKSAFHLDKIQGLISKYSSETFEIAVEFPERDGQIYPVIIIPSGVKTPVASKSDLVSAGNKLILADTVYVRSLNANNIPSTTRAIWKDWPGIVETCFDNREADVGRFLRRHLAGLTPDILKDFVSGLSQRLQPEVKTEDLLEKYLQESEQRYKTVVQERGLTLPDHGTWEVGLLIIGDVPVHTANLKFLSLLDSNNPNYTGWPVWLNSRGFSDDSTHPYIYKGTWEALIVIADPAATDIDFMRIDPKGQFYLRRCLEDDLSRSERSPKPFTRLDFGLPILRTAEALAVGLAFAKAMGCSEENTMLAFAFKWSRLKERELSSWANPGRFIGRGLKAYRDEVLVFVNIPLETPLSSLAEFVNKAVEPLFESFDGFSLSKGVVEDLTRRLIERRL